MTKADQSAVSGPIYRVVSSPFAEDEGLPWEYAETGFISWVDEVFLEGYKGDDPMPSASQCLDILQAAGYTVEVVEA